MIDIIGIITKITPTEDVDNPVVETLEGYHINSTAKLVGLDDQLVTPEIPMRVFAGVETFCYRFLDEQHFKQAFEAADLKDLIHDPNTLYDKQ